MATGYSHVFNGLECSICTELFTEPVSLACQHTFCRDCLTGSLDAGHRCCPLCRGPITEGLQVNRLVKDLVDRLRRTEVEGQGRAMCRKHDEPLKLICYNDKTLLCLVCKKEDGHRWHSFKPLSKAEEHFKTYVDSHLKQVQKNIGQLEELCRGQRGEMDATTQNLERIKGQIQAQVEELVGELREAERRVWAELEGKDWRLRSMRDNLTALQDSLTREQTRQAELEATLARPRPGAVLRWWTSQHLIRRLFNFPKRVAPNAGYERRTVQPNVLVVRPPQSLSGLVCWGKVKRRLSDNASRATGWWR